MPSAETSQPPEIPSLAGFAPPRRPFLRSLEGHLRVVVALALRDIQTRMGASYFGFLLSLLLPLGHIGVVMTVYTVLGRTSPLGGEVLLYLSSAVVPFVVWSYTHQKMLLAHIQNEVLLKFPIVKPVDIVVARAVVELATAVLVVATVYVVLRGLGLEIWIQDPPAVFYALCLAYLLGVATGSLFGVLARLNHVVMYAGFILIPLYWVTSGVFFIPDALPEQARAALAVFPLAHIVDFARTGLYASYLSDYYDLFYVTAVILACLATSFGLERALRPTLSGK